MIWNAMLDFIYNNYFAIQVVGYCILAVTVTFWLFLLTVLR